MLTGGGGTEEPKFGRRARRQQGPPEQSAVNQSSEEGELASSSNPSADVQPRSDGVIAAGATERTDLPLFGTKAREEQEPSKAAPVADPAKGDLLASSDQAKPSSPPRFADLFSEAADRTEPPPVFGKKARERERSKTPPEGIAPPEDLPLGSDQAKPSSPPKFADLFAKAEEATVPPPLFGKKAEEAAAPPPLFGKKGRERQRSKTPPETALQTEAVPAGSNQATAGLEAAQPSIAPPEPNQPSEEQEPAASPPVFGKKARLPDGRERTKTPPRQSSWRAEAQEPEASRTPTTPLPAARFQASLLSPKAEGAEEDGSPTSRLKDGTSKAKSPRPSRVSFCQEGEDVTPPPTSLKEAGRQPPKVSFSQSSLPADHSDEASDDSNAENVLKAALQGGISSDSIGQQTQIGNEDEEIKEDEDGDGEATMNFEEEYDMEEYPWYLQLPRNRSPEAEERARARSRMLRAVELRPDWGQRMAPQGRGHWNSRHHLCFSNAKLNPNYRCYFDRWKDIRDGNSPPPGRHPPEWRLSPEGESIEEREASRRIWTLWSTSRPPDRAGSFPPKLQATSSKAPRTQQSRGSKASSSSLSRSIVVPKLPKKALQDVQLRHGSYASDGNTSWQLSTNKSWRAEVSADGKASSQAASFWDATSWLDREFLPEAKKKWNSRHHILWNNERTSIHPVERKLLSKPMRSYFDRPRLPQLSRAKESPEEYHRLPLTWLLAKGPSKFHPSLSSPGFFTSADDGGFRPTFPQSAAELGWDERHYITK